MNDEMQRKAKGCLPVIGSVALVWACLIGAALSHAQVAALQPASHGNGDNTPPSGSRLISATQLRTPGVELLTVRTRKHWPASFLAASVATAKSAGDRWTWLPCGGDEANPISPANIAAREKLYRDTAAKYATDPSLYAVHAFIAPPKHSEEGFWGKMPRAAIDAQKRIITVNATVFPTQRIIWTGSANDPKANIEIIKHGVAVAPGRFVYKMNAMSPKAPDSWAGVTLLIDAAKLGADIGFEALGPSVESRFGGTWTQFVAKVKSIEKRAGKRFVYEAIYPGDLPKVGAPQ